MKSEKLGIVGRNGAGKSTLIKIICGLESADEGNVLIPKSYAISYLDQHIHFTHPTLIAECLSVFEDPLNKEYLAESILSGLGFKDGDFIKDPNCFSGGYQLRIKLCQCLLKDPQLLILDEPTNYLDLPSLIWLKKFLKKFSGEILLITHDKSFMDAVCTHTLILHRQNVKKMAAKVDEVMAQIEADELTFEKTRQSQEKKVQQLQQFVDRFKAQASKATQAQSKLKQIQKINLQDKLSTHQDLNFKFRYQATKAKLLAECEKIDFSYQPEQELIKNFNLDIQAKDRIAIIGQNGKGKSTLLNLIHEELTPNQGLLKLHNSTQMSYYKQTNKKALDAGKTLFEEVYDSNPSLGITEIRTLLASLLFYKNDIDKKISVLSGGEQSRVLMAKTLAKPCNILLLDEPTNHLDIQSIHYLTQQIKAFPGACLFVSHNEDLLKKASSKLVVFHNNTIELFDYGYREFSKKYSLEDFFKDGKKTEKKSKKPKSHLGWKKEKYVKRQIELLEKKITKIENQIKEINDFIEFETSKGQPDYTLIQSKTTDIETHQETINTHFKDLEAFEKQLNLNC